MKKSKIAVTIIAAIIVVVGVFAMVYNFVIVYNSDLKYVTYKNVEANIASVQSAYVDGDSYYKASYSFIVDGLAYGCDSNFTSDPEKYSVGDTALVRYNPKNPNLCYVSDDNRTWNYLYLCISCIVLIFGIKLFDKQLREQ